MPFIELRSGVPAIEPENYIVGGLNVFVYANKPLDASKPMPFVVIAHPRGLDYKYTEVLAREIVHKVPNTVCATFDLPNHGTRMVSKASNGDWAHGNATHAQGMLSVVDQAAAEVELVAEYLPSFILDLERATVAGTAIPLVSGVSLGGHISWKCAVGRLGEFGTHYLKGIAPIVGCPDTHQMLLDRYAIQVAGGPGLPPLPKNSYEDRVKLIGKKINIMALCGALDTLVPASYTEKWAQAGTLPAHQTVYVQPKTGHVCTPEMVDMLIDWVAKSPNY